MPDFQQFDVTLLGGTASIPRFSITCQVRDSQTGALILDLTGANEIIFPSELSSYTAAERRQFVRTIAHMLIRKRLTGVLEE